VERHSLKDHDRVFNLTESDIEPFFEAGTLNRARQLYRDGRVVAPMREDNTLFADVLDDDGYYYGVAVRLSIEGISAGCDCEPDTFCRHIGAVLLNWIHAPQDFGEDEVALSEILEFLRGMAEEGGEMEEVDPLAPDDDVWLPDSDEFPNPPNPDEPPVLTATQTPEQELRELLSEQTVRDLRAIARRRGWTLRGTRKADLIDQMVRYYQEADDTARVVESLNDDGRLALEIVALRGAMAPVGAKAVGQTLQRMEKRRSGQSLSNALKEICERGLALTVDDVYRVPLTVAHRLPPWPDLLPSYGGDPAKLEARQSPAFALTKVAFEMWQYLKEAPQPIQARDLRQPRLLEKQWPALHRWLNPTDELARLEKEGVRFWYSSWQKSIGVQFLPPALSEDDLAQLRRRTQATDEILNFAFALLTSLGLVRWEYGKAMQIDQELMTGFLGHSDAERLRLLTGAWLQQVWWSEMALVLDHVPHLQLRRSLGEVDFRFEHLLGALSEARLIVVLLLRRLVPGQWYGAADFRGLVRRLWPDFLHASSGSRRPWWLETTESDVRLSPEQPGDWQVGYAPFVTACLEGPLGWLGAVTLGYDQKGLSAFQITDLGAYALGLREQYGETASEPTAPTLTVHDDGTVVARTGRGNSGVYDVLNAAAHLDETSVQQFRYRITVDSARNAFEQGWTARTILDDLVEHSGAPVPEPLQERILAWAEAYGLVHLYDEVTLIEFADDFALKELLASTSLARHLVYEFSPRLVAIQSDAVDELRAELIQQGHTPRLV
jgi:hypothetical protein